MRTARTRDASATALRTLGGAVLVALTLVLSGCLPDPNGPAVSGPAQGDPGFADPGADPGAGSGAGSGGAPGGGGTLSEACEAAFPDSPFGTDLAAAPTVPADWAAPAGMELCTVFQASDTSAVLQYATSLAPDAVLDAWEPLLRGYTVQRSDSAAGSPILTASAGALEVSVQPYGDLGYVVVGFTHPAP